MLTAATSFDMNVFRGGHALDRERFDCIVQWLISAAHANQQVSSNSRESVRDPPG